MPCTDGGWSDREQEQRILNKLDRLKKKHARVEAMLCAVLTVLAGPNGLLEATLNNVLGMIDPTEAGVTEADIRDWWAIHQAQDVARKQEEREQAEQARLQLARELAEAEARVAELRARQARDGGA
jgi:hypothetical protein